MSMIAFRPMLGFWLSESVVGENAVLLGYGHDVGCYAHGTEVEQRYESGEGYAVVLGERLHQLESHAASAEMLEWVGVVRSLRVEDSHGRRQFFVGHVVVADDEVDAERLGVGYLFNSLDAAVEDDDELHAGLLGVVDAFLAHAVAFVVAVGNVIVDIGVKLLQELIDQCHSRATVNIVVAINEHSLLTSHGIVEPVHGHVHVLHQERVDEVGKLRAEKPLGGTFRSDASLDEQSRKSRAHAEFLAQLKCLARFLRC